MSHTASGIVALVILAFGGASSGKPSVHTVRLTGNRFEPMEPRARAGDTLRFVNGNGGPHNVQSTTESLAAADKMKLETAMTGAKIGPLSSPLLLDPDESYTMVVPAIAAGRYEFFCLPHQSNMRGALVITP